MKQPDVIPWEVGETEEIPRGLTDGEPEQLDELEFMAVTLTTLRLGLAKPVAVMEAEALTEIEDERIGADYSERPYNW